MYIDETVITLLFRVKDDKSKLKEVLEKYEERIDGLIYVTMKAYFKDTTIPKPKNKALIDFSNLGDMDFDEKNQDHIKIINKAMAAIYITPEFTDLLTKVINQFNETLVKAKTSDMSEEEIQAILDYYEGLENVLEKKQQLFEDIITKKLDQKM